MRIKNFIKKYPTTIFTLFIILTGITIICLPPDVYASSGHEKGIWSYRCDCQNKRCSTPTECNNGLCHIRQGEVITICDKNKTTECSDLYDGRKCNNGCQCAGRCEENCGRCEQKKVSSVGGCIGGYCYLMFYDEIG